MNNEPTGLCPHCAPAPNAVNHVIGHIFVGWGHGWQPCIHCKGSGVAVNCICGTCDFLDCTGHCCVNSPLFREDGKPGDGPECWHCTHGAKNDTIVVCSYKPGVYPKKIDKRYRVTRAELRVAEKARLSK